MKQEKLLLVLAQSLIGTGFVFLYIQHVRSVFEARTNVAHLTQMERESFFQREDALYYSFYKTITEAPSFMSGYSLLQNITTIEYPHSVNVIHKFYVLPEIIIGALYHVARSHQKLGLLSLLSCWRSDDLRSTLEYGYCEGQSMQFYVECVWFLGGFTLLFVYMYGLLLSRNIFGGIYAVASYVMFHHFAAKIYERPAARENFAFPAILMQMFFVCFYINQLHRKRSHCFSLFMMIKMTSLTAVALLCWQFSTVIFASQIIIMMLSWALNTTQNRAVNAFLSEYAFTQLAAICIVYTFSEDNKQYIYAWQLGPAISLFFVSLIRYYKQHIATPNDYSNLGLSLKMVPIGILIAFFAHGTFIDILEVNGFVRSTDNTYSLYRDLIIHWLLQAKVNFVTTLTACSADYKRMHSKELWGLIKTLIVKPYCVYGGVMLANFFRKWRKSTDPPKEPKSDAAERAKNYILEDFLEEHHISMADMVNQTKEQILGEHLKLLAKCDYDYDRYKKERVKLVPKTKKNDHLQFLHDIKKLKEQIQENHNKATPSQKDATTPESDNKENEEIIKDKQSIDLGLEANQNSSKKNGNGKKAAALETFSSTKIVKNIKNPKSSNNINNSYKLSASELLNDYGNFQYMYSFLQMAVFTVIGLNIRKLFFLCFTQGCVLTSTIGSLLLNNGQQKSFFWSGYLYVFLTSLIHPGFINIQEEYYPMVTSLTKGHTELDTMLEWIKMNTGKQAVFAGPIDVIGTVHLTTRRPIVNHAHLEMRQMSDLTEHVYSIYSRQQSSDIYNQCSQLKIQYLIITLNDCTNEIIYDCDLLNIWDDMQPAYRKYPQFCSELLIKTIPSFLKVFSNEKYAIIKMFSHSVQINLKFNKLPEKVM